MRSEGDVERTCRSWEASAELVRQRGRGDLLAARGILSRPERREVAAAECFSGSAERRDRGSSERELGGRGGERSEVAHQPVDDAASWTAREQVGQVGVT